MKSTTELERAVVGSLILSPVMVPEIRVLVSPGDFRDPTARSVLETINSMWQAGTLIDLLTVCAASGLPTPQVTALIDLADVDAMRDHARVIKEFAVARSAMSLNTVSEISEASVGEIGNTLEQISGRFLKMADSVTTRTEKSLGELAEEITQSVRTSIQSGVSTGSLVGISTGFPRLNRATSGFDPGELVVIAARTSIGKTSFAMNIATNMALYGGHSVAFYSLEMTAISLVMRIISSLADVDSRLLAQGRVNPYELARLEEAVERMRQMPLYIAAPERRAWNLDRLEANARRVPNLKAIFVDYIQLMESGSRNENRVQEVTAVTRGLKAIASRLGVPVIALSQLRRTTDENSEPTLSELRESGSIEQDADMVMFLHRPWGSEASKKGETELLLLKNRRGPTGKMTLNFNFSTTTFTDRVSIVKDQP